MAESETGQERTEEPTQRRLTKAREEGQVARSRELNTTLLLLAGVGGLMAMGGELGQALAELMRASFALERAAVFDDRALVNGLFTGLRRVLATFLPLFLLWFLAALLGPLLLGGALFSGRAIRPQGSRLNPLKGLKRMVSLNALVELGKSVAKFLLVGGVALVCLLGLEPALLQLGAMPLQPALERALRLSSWTVLAVSSSLIVIALADVPWQLHSHRKKLRMTRQEVLDEFKDSEGKPEVKGRLRQLQREMAQRRMMEALPEADVLITNPEHFAVALRYRPEEDAAPVVVARGTDQVALRMRELGDQHDVVRLSVPLLARAIYYTTELDQPIPAGLYAAVAQVLAYVFQLRAHRRGQAEAPEPPRQVEVPERWHFDSRGRPLGGAGGQDSGSAL